ncbi:MAG: adenosine deaminase [Clostridia bacterium]|nr:adenosine deaminase [Clostridia bacterium]
MERFGEFYLDRERDIVVQLFMEAGELWYTLRTPNHHTGNLITNLAKLCELPLGEDEHGLKIIRGSIPCYVDGSNARMYIFRLGNTKVANIYPDGRVELKASIPAISKTLMSQTKDYKLGISRTIVKTYIRSECKFESDVHTHMNGILEADILIALGIYHQIRYPLYYIRKLKLDLTPVQQEKLMLQRMQTVPKFADSELTGRYLERKIDDNTFINFAELIFGNPASAAENIDKIRNSLTVPKDGQAVFANLEKVYLYRYVFTRGQPHPDTIVPGNPAGISNPHVSKILAKVLEDHADVYRANTLFEDKLLWIARTYQAHGIHYAEISDTVLVRREDAFKRLREIHEVLPRVQAETGVLIRFLAGIRRIPLTIVRDSVTGADYFRENLRVLETIASDPYVAGVDILGEEINDILELRPVIRELVRIAGMNESFVIRIHAGENDSLRDNVENSLRCVREAVEPGHKMPILRLGHGLYTANLNTPKGKRLLQALRDDHVILEFQISSNVRLNNLSDLGHHPLKRYLHEGVACVQGTDGCALYGTDSIEEELALEKLLDLSFEELCQMRTADRQVCETGQTAFAAKLQVFNNAVGTEKADAYYARQYEAVNMPHLMLWQESHSVDARQALANQIKPLPSGMPIVIAGGSFNNSQHRTVMRDIGKKLIDACLDTMDETQTYFVIGHRLTGYEQYLVERNQGRFPVYAIVPTMLTNAQYARLRKSGVHIRVSIEPSGISLYKSFAYELFKRSNAILIALDGNSAAANLLQEAKNGKYKSLMLIDGHSRSLTSKAQTLHGYVRYIADAEETLEWIRQWQKNINPST